MAGQNTNQTNRGYEDELKQKSWAGKTWEEMTGDERADYNVWIASHKPSSKVGYTTTQGEHKVTSLGNTHNEGLNTSSQVSKSSNESSSVSGKRFADLEYDKDGYATKESVDAMKAAKSEPIRQAYQNLTDAIGASSERTKKLREQQQAALKKQALLSDLVNSGRLISDIITAGVGGNVYKREKGNDNYNEQINKLRDLQAAEDAQNNIQRAKNALEMSKAILNSDNQIDQLTANNFQSGKSESKNRGGSMSKSVSDGRNSNTQKIGPTSTTIDYGGNYDNSHPVWGGDDNADPYRDTWVDQVLYGTNNLKTPYNFENQNI